MKKIILLSIFSILVFYSNAQTTLFQTVISKHDKQQTFILENDKDSISISDNSPYESAFLISGKDTLTMIRGKGKTKDELGFKEKKKFYLINNLDTICTYRDHCSMLQIGNKTYTRSDTEEGWVYLNDNKEVVCQVYISWNWAFWYYDLVFENQHQTSELIHSIGICLKDMAYRKSAKDYQVEFIYIPIPLFE